MDNGFNTNDGKKERKKEVKEGREVEEIIDLTRKRKK